MEQYLDFMGIFEKYINCMDIFKDGGKKNDNRLFYIQKG